MPDPQTPSGGADAAAASRKPLASARRPSGPYLHLPYLKPRDYPECPVCRMRDDVVCGGQWLDGHCAWWCASCDHNWTTEREPSWKGS